MPSSDEILNSLSTIANQWQLLAIVWHIYFGVLAAGLVFGLRPSRPTGGVLLALPLLSVSVLAWMSANPFNGTMFAIAAVALIVIALRQPDAQLRIAPTWAVVAGALMYLFGWVYPHFLDTVSFVPYLYDAPVGLVPCPTLSIVIGLGLVVAGLNSRAWSAVLGAMGVFYGVFGAFRLGVTIDVVLLVGALLLLTLAFLPRTSMREPSLAH